MKTINKCFGAIIILLFTGLMAGCSGTEDAGNIEVFEGTFVGFYRALIYDTEDDTVVVTVDADLNKVYIASAILGTSFEATYNSNSGRAIIDNLSIDTLKFVQGQAVNYAYNTTVQSGFCEMRNNDTELFIQLNQARIETHTIDPPVPEPLTIPSVITPGNMDPI